MTPGDRAILRLALMRELETLNTYQDMADRAEDPAIRELVLHVMDEEQEHVAEFAALLRQGDPALEAAWGREHVRTLEGLPVATPAEEPGGKASSPPPMPGTGWTVGSLLES